MATKIRKILLTAFLTLVETQQYKDNPSDDQEQTNEVKILNMLLEGSSLMWIKIKEEEQDANSSSACWSRINRVSSLSRKDWSPPEAHLQVDKEAPVKKDSSWCGLYKTKKEIHHLQET